MDDPIVRPGQPGASHSHDFFGNTGTSPFSTLSSLRATGSTTCDRAGDTAAYWVPTLLEAGRKVTATRLRAYYRPGTKDPASVRPLPAGLRIVAGDAHATTPQPTHVVTWGCGVDSSGNSKVPTCRAATLVLHVYFPDCWDGLHLDSADHASHMAYTRFGRCPADHPVPVPKLTEDVLYPIRGSSAVTLASGSALTAHADFFNAWDQPTLEALTRSCLTERQQPCAGPPAAARRAAPTTVAASTGLLPFTGGRPLSLLAVGSVLVALGAASLGAARRRNAMQASGALRYHRRMGGRS
jgi:hypothetical protein